MSQAIQSRYLASYIQANPDNLAKMIFIAGARQVGKTTLLESLSQALKYKNILILNWDRPADRLPIKDIYYSAFKELLLNSSQKPLVVFDELHKYSKWKSFLKGYFDTFRGQIDTFVTGSARLDVYRRGGDSLLGRYWLFHLHPFSLGELTHHEICMPPKRFSQTASKKVRETYAKLFQLGGFPDPYLSGSATTHRRWKNMRRERLIKEDLRDLSRIHDLSYMDNLMNLITASVGSTLSVNSLRENLNVSYNAVATWIKWLEAVYYCFAIKPYTKKIARALKKECKYYLMDWSEIADPAARFENMVAMHLKKSVDFWNESGVGQFDLRFIRDTNKREVDFLILNENKPWLLLECKLSATEIPESLCQINQQLKPEHAVLLTHEAIAPKYRVIKDHKYWLSDAATFLQSWV